MLRNVYKREDVFVCRHELHRRFDYRVSAFHVLREKGCYPEGCVDFLWKCKLLNKGGACPKGYKHVGNNCTNCRFYDEEKIHRYPELMLPPEVYREFLHECREFDDWLRCHEGRMREVGGRVGDIRPHLIMRRDRRRVSFLLRGFLLRIEEGYIGRDGLADAFHLHLSGAHQKRAQVALGDSIEGLARIRFDRGRLVAASPRGFGIENRSGASPAKWDAALLDRLGAVILRAQPQRCLHCERGVLVDVEELSPGRHRPRREMLCLEGIGRPEECPFEALQAMRGRVLPYPASQAGFARDSPPRPPRA